MAAHRAGTLQARSVIRMSADFCSGVCGQRWEASVCCRVFWSRVDFPSMWNVRSTSRYCTGCSHPARIVLRIAGAGMCGIPGRKRSRCSICTVRWDDWEKSRTPWRSAYSPGAAICSRRSPSPSSTRPACTSKAQEEKPSVTTAIPNDALVFSRVLTEVRAIG